MSRYRRRRLSDMNVVPYIDVMLVLLIIFMITSPLLTQSVEVTLPAVEQSEDISSAVQETQYIVVTIDAQKRIFLDEDTHALNISHLLSRIIALIQQSPDTQVLVRGDERVAYGEVVKIISLLQKAGVEKVGLLTKPMADEN